MNIEDKIALWGDRFKGRTEVFGKKSTFYSARQQKWVTEYQPIYINKFKNPAIRRATEIQDPSEMYVPLKASNIEAHINGVDELLIYNLKRNHKIHFGAMDFDLQHSFENVLKIAGILDEHFVPYGIARSTRKGHHIYIFFDEEIEAEYFTSYVNYLYHQAGFVLKLQQGEITQTGDPWSHPEVFPKTIRLAENPKATGYGIKPPMQGTGMRRDQNCWVDKDNLPIGGKGDCEEQWEYFQKIPKCKTSAFKTLLVDNDIPVEEIRISEHRGAVVQHQRVQTKYVPPTDGDLMLVIQSCPALKRHWEGPDNHFPHDYRVALLSMALRTKNGVEILKERFGDTPQTQYQIDYAIESHQHPWTCKTLQQKGICIVGRDPLKASNPEGGQADRCFTPVAPRAIIEGKVVINPDNLPEDRWPDPSPIRTRVPTPRTGMANLKDEIDRLAIDDPDLTDKIGGILKRSFELSDAKSRAQVTAHLKSKKLMSPTDLKHFEKEMKAQQKEEVEQQVEKNDGYRMSNGLRYGRSEEGGYVALTVSEEGSLKTNVLSNFEFILEKDVTYFPVIGESTRQLQGFITCKEQIVDFQMTITEWVNDQKFKEKVTLALGTAADFGTNNLNLIRTAAHLFGSSGCIKTTTYESYGFDSYGQPSVFRSSTGNIDSNGFTVDDNVTIDLSKGAFAKGLKLLNLSREEFSRAVHTIKRDLLEFQAPILTYTAVAHSLQATIHSAYMPFKESPVLWVQGLTGCGKSTLAFFAQAFHGEFPKLLAVHTTSRSIELYTMLFKDALLVVDDYKDSYSRQGTVPLIQKIYDRSERGRLGKDMRQSESINCQGLVMFTAEDVPSAEASTMARMILLESKNKIGEDPLESERHARIAKASSLFSGVTAKFIQNMLMRYPDPHKIHDRFHALASELLRGTAAAQNAIRIVNNLVANYLTWELFLEFLLSEGFLTEQENGEYRDQHWRNMEVLKRRMLSMCSNEQASNVFIHLIKEAIFSGDCQIEGIPTHNERAEVIGFLDKRAPNTVYLFPDRATAIAKKLAKNADSQLSHSKDSIARQLDQDGAIVKRTEGRLVFRKKYRGALIWVWALSMEKMGLSNEEEIDPSQPNNILRLEQTEQKHPEEEGLFDPSEI